MAEFVTGVLVAAGILNAPKVLKDFVDICSSIRKAIDRYVDAKNLYEKLLDKVMGFQEQALRLLKSISKIVKRLSPQEKASFNNMLKGIHLELLGWRKWVEENRIKPHDGIWDTFVKKMKAGLGRDLRDAQEAVDEMSKKLGQIDQRLDLNYR